MSYRFGALRHVHAYLLLLTALFSSALIVPTTAVGARPEPLIQFPGDGTLGASAGRMDLPGSLAASPLTGNVYVADRLNQRVDEFTAWGEFVRAFGWNVDASDPKEELQVCTASSGCKKGSEGSGPGQFDFPRGGLAVDPAGNVYVGDLTNSRVQKFSPSGEFLLSFGGSGTGDGQFSTVSFGSYIALSPDGESVYVGDRSRIQEFASDGSFNGQITFKALHEQSAGFPDTPVDTRALAVDPSTGAIYLSLERTIQGEPPGSENVYKIDPATGELVDTLTAPTLRKPTALAVDSNGNLYVVNNGEGAILDGHKAILEFDSGGNLLVPDKAEEEAALKEEKDEQEGNSVVPYERFGQPGDGTSLVGLATNGACEAASDDLYVVHMRQATSLSYVKVYGPSPQDVVKCPPPPPGVPEIDAQYAISVGTEGAVLRAEINPRFALDTTYYVQYGTGKCSEGGCAGNQPLPPGSNLTKKISGSTLKTAGVFLSGLEPGTTYNYRFVVQSSGGGPVLGSEETFTTFPVPNAPFEACANQAFRTGPSARLPECRAYEMVSPANRTPAGDIVGVGRSLHQPAELNQSAADGEKLAYSAEFAFADAVSSPATTEYIASRRAGEGWSTHAITPPRGLVLTNPLPNIKLDVEEKAFTADLCSTWLLHVTDPPLSANALAGFANLYRRQNCGAESYSSITSAEPFSTLGAQYLPELQGFSTDGSRAVFRANAKLTDDAPDLGESAYNNVSYQLYWESEGTLRFVCVLPDGSPFTAPCSAGTPGISLALGRGGSVSRAMSADGSRVYWSAISPLASGGARLHLRENAGEEQSAVVAGKCTEEDKACSYSVSAAGINARFWTAAVDGSRALYGEHEAGGEKLREYDAEGRKSTTIAQEVEGVAGASDDLSRFYFASRKAIGGKGEAGKPNLYLREEGATSLVGTLSERDLEANPEYFAIGPVDPRPIPHGARITPDGRHLLFASDARLTGYDNRDAIDGRPDLEVYLYDAGSAGPLCISCNPSGARPTARQFDGFNGVVRGISALIPVSNSQLYTPRALSTDGSRAFFESFEALVARDTNGKADVYEWRRASVESDCEAIGADLYAESAGGCLSLISSGESPADSEFVDASLDGRDVFIRTASSLVADDPGLIDIYDARIGGGFAPKPGIPPSCEGEACQSPPAPPNDPTPASSSFQGAGNVVEKQAKKKRKKKRARKKKAHKKKAQQRRKRNGQQRPAR